jgi:hypothetical protein
MAIAPRMIPAIQGVPVMRDGQQAGIAPTGYAPGTVVQMLGQQLMQPPPPPPPPPPLPLPPELFLPVQDDTGDVGEQETNAANAQASGTGNIGMDLGLPSGLMDPVVDLGLGPFNPTPMGLGLSALGMAVPGLAPVGLAFSAVNALSDLVGPAQVNALGQTQQFGFGNQNIDMFGNPVGSPENIASIMSFDMETNEFTSPTTGEKMSPAPAPDISLDLSTPANISATADQTQAADPTQSYGDQFGESTASDSGDDSATVICTEMHRQGRISTPVYEADQEFGQHMRETDPYVMDGYLAWANTVVSLMQKSCAFSWFVALFAKPWAREMYRREAGRGRGSLAGKVMMKVGIPVCRFIGKRNARGWLPPFRNHTHA